MPRTKITKTSKRNREVSEREEITRLFEAQVEEYKESSDKLFSSTMSEVESAINRLKTRMSKQLLNTKIGDVFEMGLLKFSDFQQVLKAQNSSVISNGAKKSVAGAVCGKISNPNDDGYSTDHSRPSTATAGVYVSHAQGSFVQPPNRGRTPGPLSSAKAQRRPRRSKSFCTDAPSLVGSTKPTTVSMVAPSSTHVARNKMRTPQVQRSKAFSADRASRIDSSPSSPPTAIMRWPKPGELVLSKCGSPVVAQVMSEKFVNCNIPIKDGVLSLQPKKLTEINPDLIESLKPDTINQIKTLCSNMNLILDLASKGNKENSA